MTSKTWITDRSPGTEDLDSDGRIQIPVDPADPYSKGTAVSVSCWSEGLPWRKTHKGAAKQKQASITKYCGICSYWSGQGKDSEGFCRRYAPRPHSPVPPDKEFITLWPTTWDTDWCGEWEARQ